MRWKEPVEPLAKGVDFDVMRAGISGGLSKASKGLAELTHLDVLLDENECGYFTFFPMTKTVCGTYTHATGEDCDRTFTTKGNVCTKERSNWAGQNQFYSWAANDYGEPTVRGHMTFVRTDCNGGHRMSLDFQSDIYKLASKNGAALNGDDYEGWRKVSRANISESKDNPLTCLC